MLVVVVDIFCRCRCCCCCFAVVIVPVLLLFVCMRKCNGIQPMDMWIDIVILISLEYKT